MSIELLLDTFQLLDIKNEAEVDLAYKELFWFGTFEDRHKLTLVYNAIKKKIRTRAKTKEFFTVVIQQKCKKCENITMKNGLVISSGFQEFTCGRCKGMSPKKDSCKKCNATGKVKIICPACKGKKYVMLKRKVSKGV